jgi:hypothetical protein
MMYFNPIYTISGIIRFVAKDRKAKKQASRGDVANATKGGRAKGGFHAAAQ